MVFARLLILLRLGGGTLDGEDIRPLGIKVPCVVSPEEGGRPMDPSTPQCSSSKLFGFCFAFVACGDGRVCIRRAYGWVVHALEYFLFVWVRYLGWFVLVLRPFCALGLVLLIFFVLFFGGVFGFCLSSCFFALLFDFYLFSLLCHLFFALVSGLCFPGCLFYCCRFVFLFIPSRLCFSVPFFSLSLSLYLSFLPFFCFSLSLSLFFLQPERLRPYLILAQGKSVVFGLLALVLLVSVWRSCSMRSPFIVYQGAPNSETPLPWARVTRGFSERTLAGH